MSFLGSSAKQIQSDINQAKRIYSLNTNPNYNKTDVVPKKEEEKSSIKDINIHALGASDYAGIGDAINQYVTGAPGAAIVNAVSDYVGNSGSGYGYGSSANSVSNGASADMQEYVNMINSITDRNNAWAAEQAQKQMDFQERMSSTAHQREVADLKAAGLNPVLSVSGGNGAQAMSGSMAQPDTSNTRLLAEMSLASIDSLTNSAVQLASYTNGKLGSSFANKLLNVAEKYVVPTLARGAARALSKGLFG